jgi:general secretion pathway protein D
VRRFLLSFIASLILLLALHAPLTHAASDGVVMNFTEVDISTMVKFISELTGKNFVLDERVKGKISVFSPAKLTTDEAFALFTSVLELKGFTVVQSGKIYKVVPIASAKQAGTRLLGSEERVPLSDAYLARVFNLTHISAQEALVFLQPIISKDGHIASFGPGNMLLVVDAATNLQKVVDILQLIDTSQRREGAELVYLKHGSAEGIATVLREWLSGKGARAAVPAGQQPVNTGGVQVI